MARLLFLNKTVKLDSVNLKGKNGSYCFNPNEKSSILRFNGKFSIIYKGESEENGVPVLIKMLHPRWNESLEERKRFVNEYLHRIRNEFIPETLDICELGKNLYIIREYIEGRDLTSYRKDKIIYEAVKKEGKNKITLKIAEAFISLHSEKIIHGDIKPSNILLEKGKDGIEIKIIDLGLALPFEHKSIRNSGKPLLFALIYAAPELMLNLPELIHPATDVYSLALTIYEFLTGEKPFEVSNPAIMMSVQLNQILASHSKLNENTLRVLNQAAFKFQFQKPVQYYTSDYIKKSLRSAIICRYQTMQDFKNALEGSFNEKKSGIKRWFK